MNGVNKRHSSQQKPNKYRRTDGMRKSAFGNHHGNDQFVEERLTDTKAAQGTGHLHSLQVAPTTLLTHKGGRKDAGEEAAASATAQPALPRPRDEGRQAPVRGVRAGETPPCRAPTTNAQLRANAGRATGKSVRDSGRRASGSRGHHSLEPRRGRQGQWGFRPFLEQAERSGYETRRF